jgi:dolichol-phosphate mannosyltransferase
VCQLDIIIPVYNEGENIINVLESLRISVKTPFRILICYDHDTDNTLEALKHYDQASQLKLTLVKNRGNGAFGAVMTGFEETTAPAILVFPADDTTNAVMLDRMYEKIQQGCDIACASRFIPGGCMKGCPWLKDILVRTAAFTLHYIAGIPTHDATNGFRMFSRRVIEQIPIETQEGWAFSLELLVKAHRLGWKIGEVPARWIERTYGKSNFRVFKWVPIYLRWYFYAFATPFRRKYVALKQ